MTTVKKAAPAADPAREMEAQVHYYQAQMEKMSAATSAFTHAAAHDLKAPLTRIGYYCSLLKEDAAEGLSDDCRGYVDRMLVNVRRAQQLIDDLQSYSRTLHNEEEESETDLTGLVSRVVDDMAPLMSELKAKVTVESLPQMPVYPMHMRQLFQNMLLNALKYKSPDRDPVVHISCRDEGDCWLFAVQDNGLGIDRKYHEKIFKPFERLHTQDQIEGSGLGLAAVQKIVELHHGKVWVDSMPGVGATFYFAIRK